MITPEIFKERFPEFAEVSDTKIQMLLDESYLLLCNENKYQDTMVLYLTAHNLVVCQKQSDGNSKAFQTVASKTVGNVSTSFANPTIQDGDYAYYMSTSYGQNYLRYKNALSVGNVHLVWLKEEPLKICLPLMRVN